MFKGFILGVFSTIVLAALCVYIVVQSGIIPANVDSGPIWLESWAAGTSLHATLAREAPKGANPVMEHLTRWERVALVTDVEWIKQTMRFFSFLMPGAMKSFPTSEATQARAWTITAS